MCALLENGVGAVGPMSDNVSGEQFVGRLLGDRWIEREEIQPVLDSSWAGKACETKFLAGICVMTRRETLHAHGLLDEAMELGADDLEFSWRLRMLGQTLLIAEDAFVSHERGVSFASLPNETRISRQVKSDFSLLRKLQAFHGEDSVPVSMELFGTPIFDEAMERWQLLLAGETECSAS